jgi:hypothetical protein
VSAATARLTPGPPSTTFTVSNIKVSPTGAVSFAATVPGPGQIEVLETAWRADEAKAATVQLQPAPGRFVFSRLHTVAPGGGTLPVTVMPNSRGAQLVAHHTHTVRIRLWVTYQPPGGASVSHGFYGLFVTR